MTSPYLINLPTIVRDDGDITVAENLPFPIERVYWIYGVDYDTERGSHAHKTLWQLIIAVHGQCFVHLDNGTEKTTWAVERPTEGLLVPPMHWRTIDTFDAPAVILVLASAVFDESDYIRDYQQFLEALNGA